MPNTKQTETNRNAQLNQLANALAYEMAEHQFRLANYATPFGADPEQIDFDRAAKYIDDYGTDLPTTVFRQASPNLQDRVAYVIGEYNSRKESLEALAAAGAEVTATNQELYDHAKARVFNVAQSPQRRTA